MLTAALADEIREILSLCTVAEFLRVQVKDAPAQIKPSVQFDQWNAEQFILPDEQVFGLFAQRENGLCNNQCKTTAGAMEVPRDLRSRLCPAVRDWFGWRRY